MASYYVWSAAAGAANGTSWTNAYTTLTAAFSGHTAGDVYYVAHDHAESTAAAITLTSSGVIANPTKVVCVNRSGSVPPVSADRRATATVSTTGVSNISFAGFTHYDGIIFTAGNSTNIAHLIITTAASQWLRFDNCSLRLGGSNAANLIYVGGSAGSLGGTFIELNNTTVSFTSTGQTMQFVTMLRWRNTPSALLGTIPDILFSPVGSRGGLVECIGVDLSAAGSGKTIALAATSTSQAVTYKFVDCKLNASVTKATVPSGYGTCDADFIRSGSSGVNYQIHRQRISALLTEETTVVRTTGGVTDGTTKISWKVVTTTNCTYSMPFECPPIAIWNDTTGSAKTATIECIASAIMTDQECWVDLEYLGDASSPQGSFVSDAKADLLATAVNQTSSSEAWGGSTTAFKLNVTFTAQQKGWVYGRVKVGKASSTVYVDPLITLT